MTDILRPVLELFVIIPGILLAYLPVKNYLRQTPLKLTAWLLPFLLGICILGGAVCCALQIPTRWFLFPLLPVIMLIYHKTLKISKGTDGAPDCGGSQRRGIKRCYQLYGPRYHGGGEEGIRTQGFGRQ